MKKYASFLWFTVPVGLSISLCAAAAAADKFPTVDLQPKYKVEAVRFRCNHETWVDWWTSDEVRVGISTPTTTTISKVFSDVDAGETKSFAPDQSCIYPIDGQNPSGNSVFEPSETWSCSNAGAPGPISFTVVMAEEDGGFFHDCLSDFPTGGCAFYSDQSTPDPNDDLIGRHTVEITPEQLAAANLAVGESLEETITLREAEGDVTGTGTPDPAEYTLTYRITRVGGFIWHGN